MGIPHPWAERLYRLLRDVEVDEENATVTLLLGWNRPSGPNADSFEAAPVTKVAEPCDSCHIRCYTPSQCKRRTGVSSSEIGRPAEGPFTGIRPSSLMGFEAR